MTETIVAVDLFCGGGGLSTALAKACEELDVDVELIAVNHWGKAIETHKRNHPWATHLNAKIEELHPPDVIEPGTVDILIAAPECTHFSAARGGKPVNEQQRASPMHVLDWVGKLQPRTVLLENVPEFESWGAIVDGKPTRDGAKFEAWKHQLEADRYSVRHTKLNAADYGDATSRRRFFVVARRDYRPEFPDPTHSEDGDVPDTEPWRTAAEIIDWSDRGESVWTRSRPLSNNTMRRIADGIRRYGDDRLAPFADALEEIGTQRDIDDHDRDVTLLRDLQDDIVSAADLETAVDERTRPFLVTGPVARPDHDTADRQAPSMVMGQQSNARALDADDHPVPTIATRGAVHYIEPTAFVLPRNGSRRDIYSNPPYAPGDQPLHTVTAQNQDGHLVSPFLVEYYGNSDTQSIEDPLPTVTTKDRHALCVPNLYPWGLDLRYRMLQPPELAAAQGFPNDYDFAGNKGEITKQIGNAVPVNLGKALCKHLLIPTDQPTVTQYEDRQPPVADGGQTDTEDDDD